MLLPLTGIYANNNSDNLTRSLPPTRPSWASGFARTPFATSQVAQVRNHSIHTFCNVNFGGELKKSDLVQVSQTRSNRRNESDVHPPSPAKAGYDATRGPKSITSRICDAPTGLSLILGHYTRGFAPGFHISALQAWDEFK